MLRGAVLAAFLALLPTAAAAEAVLVVESAEPVLLDGAVEVVAGAGSLVAHVAPTTAVYELRGATGLVRISEWTDVGPCPPGCGNRVNDPPSVRSWRVEDATLAFAVRDEGFRFRAATDAGGEIRVAADVTGRGHPHRLPRPLDDGEGAPPASPERVALGWQAGWPFAGRFPVGGVEEAGFPATGGLVDLRGPLRFQAHDGNVTFVAADGETVANRLGNWTERDATVPFPGASVRVERWARLVFEGTAASATFETGDTWGVSGPALLWHVRGGVAWDRASGRAEADRSFAFEDARVVAEGDLVLVPSPAALRAGAATPARYEARGDVASLAVDTLLLTRAAPSDRVATASAFAVAVALVGLAARLAAVLYTRIASDTALDHPTRRRMWEVVAARPGVLQEVVLREVGGARGVFLFHLHVLVRAGFLRIERVGRYRALRPAAGLPDAGAGDPVIPQPVARAVFAALPTADAVAVRDLTASLGLSRQLVRYHLARLEARGLVTVGREAGLGLAVRRAAAPQTSRP